jgi:hypothetical protein
LAAEILAGIVGRGIENIRLGTGCGVALANRVERFFGAAKRGKIDLGIRIECEMK